MPGFKSGTDYAIQAAVLRQQGKALNYFPWIALQPDLVQVFPVEAGEKGDGYEPGFTTRHGLPRRTLMEFLLKLLANLYDPKDGATSDRVITAMARLAPSV